jgi:hypothetical protein
MPPQRSRLIKDWKMNCPIARLRTPSGEILAPHIFNFFRGNVAEVPFGLGRKISAPKSSLKEASWFTKSLGSFVMEAGSEDTHLRAVFPVCISQVKSLREKLRGAYYL